MATKRNRSLGLCMVFSGLLSLAGIALQFSPPILLFAAFLAALGGFALLLEPAPKSVVTAKIYDEPLVLTHHVPPAIPRHLFTALEEEAARIQSLAQNFNGNESPLPDSHQHAAEAGSLADMASEATLQAQRKLEALRGSVAQLRVALGNMHEFAARGNLLALNAAIAGSRGGAESIAGLAGSVREFAVEARQASDIVVRELEEIHGNTEEAARLVQALSGALRQIGEATGQLQWAAEQRPAQGGGDVASLLDATERLLENAAALNDHSLSEAA